MVSDDVLVITIVSGSTAPTDKASPSTDAVKAPVPPTDAETLEMLTFGMMISYFCFSLSVDVNKRWTLTFSSLTRYLSLKVSISPLYGISNEMVTDLCAC